MYIFGNSKERITRLSELIFSSHERSCDTRLHFEVLLFCLGVTVLNIIVLVNLRFLLHQNEISELLQVTCF